MSKRDRGILAEMVRTDFKLRYQGSWLGYTWSLMKPILLFVILYFVFTSVFRVGGEVENYPVYLLLGIVLWTFFTEATTRSLSIIVDRGDLIRKIALPRYLLVVSVNISASINFLINLIVVFVFGLVLGLELSWLTLLLPLLFLELIWVTLAVSLLLSSLYVKARDISYVWEVGLQAAFYATPILYPISFIPEKYVSLAFINPLAQIIQDVRRITVTDQAETIWSATPHTVILTFVVLVLASVMGVMVFRKSQSSFAEDV